MTDKRIIENSKVLVTGGAGFIGSNLVDRLLEQGNQVVCLDNFATGKRENLELALQNKDFTLIEGDIRNFEDCVKAVKGCDYVLHQAALGSVPRSIKDPMTSTDVNIGGFVKMLFAAKEEGVKRFVYAASSSTYGDSTIMPKVEHIIGNPLSPYAITKYANEIYAQNFTDTYGIETVGLRYFNVFGRRQDPNGAYAAVIPKFVMQLMAHESPVINGDGKFSRDFTYVENVIQANQLAAIVSYDKILEVGVGSKSVFNVAYGDRTDLNQLFNILKENLSKFDSEILNVDVIHGENRVGDIPHSLANIDKGRSILGYDPEYDIRLGLSEACKWYWENLK
ncbi:SDR family oxidoreductase [Marinifilum sp. D737]|uniref:SDR family oxidoreductase n=1 Tax=Marinifilum sp. D737 TaxID=2969628 RepID=UPI002276EFF0|nr:SDR family oxidoreductase [Marinifilum sp. D737]MCY1634891.1 SDR family oxidoreductase [Marinifilum sp. D737]